MKKIAAALLLTLLLCLCCMAQAMTLTPVTDTLRPGRTTVLTFTAEEAGSARIDVVDSQGSIVMTVTSLNAAAGENRVLWNGTQGGKPCPEGSWLLSVTMGDANDTCPITVGSPVPYLTAVSASADTVSAEEPVIISYYASMAGTLTMHQGEAVLLTRQVRQGSGSLVWDAAGRPQGPITVTLILTDAEGEVSAPEAISLTVETPEEEMLTWTEDDEVMLIREPDPVDQRQFTPSYASPYAGTDTTMNYWTLPMDISDTKAVWEMLMQPVTVLDSGAKVNPAKVQITIRKEPSLQSQGVGVVTCMTQSVHVLERGKEWSLIECYSSSFHDSKVKAWNMLTTGYVQTKYLKTVKPYEHIGLVIDKLTQRLYIFKDGELYDTLLISTGLANEKQPYNETRSGEFLLQCPAVGQFRSDNLYCDMGIRFNGGDLLHEVPHTETRYGKNYTTNEKQLGLRASHGCIRVQRLKTAKGTNMSWLWKNRHDEMKLVIWEDWQGREYPRPAEDSLVYYNPEGGSYYHSSADCQTSSKTMSPFRYGDLEEPGFATLVRCTSCAAPLRKADIDAINKAHALGGEHDPILSAAQRKCAEALGLKGYYNQDPEAEE